MNNKLFVLSFLFLALSIGFAVAQAQDLAFNGAVVADVYTPGIVADIYIPENVIADVYVPEPVIVNVLAVDLTSPSNDQVFELGDNVYMDFLVSPMSSDIKCQVNVYGDADYYVETMLRGSGYGRAYSKFQEGSYEWYVVCTNSQASYKSETRSFKVEAPVEPQITSNTNTNTNTGNSGGSSNDDDSNGRRLQPISLPLQELSNTAEGSEGSEDQEGSAGITGAVIGALGKKTLTGIIILAIVLAVAGLVIYNRRKIGVVKAK